MINRKEMKCFLDCARPVFRANCPAPEAVARHAMDEFHLLKPELPRLGAESSWMFMTPCITALALYRSLRDELPEARALALVEACLHRHVDATLNPFWMRRAFQSPFLIKLVFTLGMALENSRPSPEGWRFELLPGDSRNFLCYNARQCAIKGFLDRQNAPELGPLLCGCDFYMMRYFRQDITFRRTSTLIEGAGLCDFRYRVE